jgi:hypothetical protein
MTTSQEAIGSPHKKRTGRSAPTQKSRAVRVDGDFLRIGGRNRYPIVDHWVVLPVEVAKGILLKQLPRGIRLIFSRGAAMDPGTIRIREIIIERSSDNSALIAGRGLFLKKEWCGIISMEAWARLFEASVLSNPIYGPESQLFDVKVDDEKLNASFCFWLNCHSLHEAFTMGNAVIENLQKSVMSAIMKLEATASKVK